MSGRLRNVESVQEDVDLELVAASVLDQLKASIRESGAKVSLSGDSCIVRGDAVQLKMVFVNLIQNAIDAINQAAAKQRNISVELAADAQSFEIVVGDSGQGWPGGTLEEMLLNTSKPGGSGIGLYVVKTAVENHRGRIAVRRSPLGGAEFRVTLPRPKRRPRREAR